MIIIIMKEHLILDAYLLAQKKDSPAVQYEAILGVGVLFHYLHPEAQSIYSVLLGNDMHHNIFAVLSCAYWITPTRNA